MLGFGLARQLLHNVVAKFCMSLQAVHAQRSGGDRMCVASRMTIRGHAGQERRHAANAGALAGLTPIGNPTIGLKTPLLLDSWLRQAPKAFGSDGRVTTKKSFVDQSPMTEKQLQVPWNFAHPNLQHGR